jgi:hypothetical protein
MIRPSRASLNWLSALNTSNRPPSLRYCFSRIGTPLLSRSIVREQFALALELHAHSAHANDIRVRIERRGLDVLVDDVHVPIRRA